jgi:hypothetical protein
VGFQSFATDLVAGDTNNRADVFVGTPAGAATVAQPIQAVVNRVPRSDGEFGHSLVAGKELVLRTYVRTRRSLGPSHDAMVEVCVDGDVDACPAGKSFQALGQAWAFGTQFTESNRRNAVESINVFLRNGAEAVLTPGVHAFEIRISPSNPGSFPVVERTLEGLFHVGKSIDLYQYPVVLEDMAMNAISPSAAVLGDGASMVRATYPVDENQVQNLIRGPEKFADLPTTAPLLDAAKRNLALAVARRLVEDRKTGSGSVVFGAGVLPSLVDGSSPIPGTIGYTYRDLAGVVVSLDLDPDSMISQIASTMAHELGHQLGFGEEYCFDGTPGEVVLETPCAVNGTKFRDANPPPQRQAEGDEVGNHVTEQMLAFDVKPIAGGRAAVFGPPGSPYYGYVGAGDDTTSWTTAKEYDFLYRTLTTPPPGPAVARGLAPRTILFITGTIDAAGTATLDPFLIFETDDEYPAPPPGDTYTLEILDGNEQVLATLSFDLTFEQEIHAGEDTDVVTVDVTPFSLAIDLPQGAAAVRLREGGSALAEVEKSANAPSVSWVDVVEQVGNVRALEWMGSDLDGDEVTYTLLYSPNGTVLETLAMDLTGTTFSFDLDDVTPLTFGGFLRVRASDGWNTAEADFPIGPAFAVLDVDANGAVQALTDGLLVLRRMFGLSGTALTGSALGAGCTRCDSAAIVAYLDTITAQLDVDGNGSRTALTDGLLVLRHLFGLGGTVLTSGVVGVGCTRCDAAAIVPWLQGID